jgi:nitronate monooxygenase
MALFALPQGRVVTPGRFIQEVREWFDGLILLSGAISAGQNVLAAQAMGADLAYIGSAFIATKEANADQAYKQALVDYAASDIVYTNLFTGIHGNYLKPSIEAAGMDPDNLPQSDPSKMDFGSGSNSKAKAWKDIWGCGQGINAIKEVQSTADLVHKLKTEYDAARKRLLSL